MTTFGLGFPAPFAGNCHRGTYPTLSTRFPRCRGRSRARSSKFRSRKSCRAHRSLKPPPRAPSPHPKASRNSPGWAPHDSTLASFWFTLADDRVHITSVHAAGVSAGHHRCACYDGKFAVLAGGRRRMPFIGISTVFHARCTSRYVKFITPNHRNYDLFWVISNVNE